MTLAKEPRITIFRPGSFTSMEGHTVAFSSADLASVVASYDERSDPAPLVVGHPQLDHPAYGWVKSLEMDGDRLVAVPRDVEPNFAEAVRSKRYPKVSASFYPPNNAHNPKPGSWYLKHIGFLGGAAPSVKGLGMVQFGERTDRLLNIATSQGHENFAHITRFTAPCGRSMECDARELGERIRAVMAECPQMSFADAMDVACIDVALENQVICFGDPDPASVEGQVRVLYKMKRLQFVNPTVSFVEAYRAVAEDRGGLSIPFGYSVDREAAENYRKARALQLNTPGLSLIEAARKVTDH